MLNILKTSFHKKICKSLLELDLALKEAKLQTLHLRPYNNGIYSLYSKSHRECQFIWIEQLPYFMRILYAETVDGNHESKSILVRKWMHPLPITVLFPYCVLLISFERVVFKHLYNHFHENQILTSLRSGFIPGDSTVNQLTFLYTTFSQSLDSGKEVRVVFCDLSKAFDRAWYEGLLLKLEAAGIKGSLLAWFRSYLSNRKQRVVLPGAESKWNEIRAGFQFLGLNSSYYL